MQVMQLHALSTVSQLLLWSSLHYSIQASSVSAGELLWGVAFSLWTSGALPVCCVCEIVASDNDFTTLVSMYSIWLTGFIRFRSEEAKGVWPGITRRRNSPPWFTTSKASGFRIGRYRRARLEDTQDSRECLGRSLGMRIVLAPLIVRDARQSWIVGWALVARAGLAGQFNGRLGEWVGRQAITYC